MEGSDSCGNWATTRSIFEDLRKRVPARQVDNLLAEDMTPEAQYAISLGTATEHEFREVSIFTNGSY